MFFNLSNHRFDTWDECQLTAAQKMGEPLIDVPFPAVDPELSSEAISQLADEQVEKLQSLGLHLGDVVHVMGELTLTFAIVLRLQRIGVVCIASTTERHTEVLPNGSKISRFDFIGFRDYEIVSL